MLAVSEYGKTDGYSLETCRCLVSLLDVSSLAVVVVVVVVGKLTVSLLVCNRNMKNTQTYCEVNVPCIYLHAVLFLHARPDLPVGDAGLLCCVHVTSFER